MSRHTDIGAPTRQSRQTQRSTAVAPKVVNKARLVAMAGLLLGLAVLGLAGGGFFTVSTINVVGANLPVAQIQQAAGVSGQNIFTVQSDRVVENVATVSSVEVTKVETSFPGVVTIYARVRQPVIAWRSTQGLFLLDATGHEIGQVNATAFPIVSGGGQPPNGDEIEAVRYAVTALPVAANGAIAGITIDPHTGLTIEGKGSWRAVLGLSTARTLIRRVATLVAILQTATKSGQHVSFIDLRYKEPYYRVSGG